MGAGISPTTTAIRIGVLAATVAVLWHKHAVDDAIASLWGILRHSPTFSNDSFEPVLSTISFAPPLVFFHALDKYSSTPSGAWLKMYRVRPHAEDMSAWEFLSWRELMADPTRSRVPVLAGYLLPLLLFDWFYPRRKLPESAPGIAQLVGEVVCLLVLYDFFFFMVHRALHRFPWLYRMIHKKHHTNTAATRANDVVRLTFTEEALDVGCSIIAVNLLRAHPLSRAIYDVVIVWLLVDLHSGYDFPWMPHRVAPQGWMGGAPRHDAHHAKGDRYFQKFFTYLDDYAGPVTSKHKSA